MALRRPASSGQLDEALDVRAAASVDQKPSGSLADMDLATALSRIHQQLHSTAAELADQQSQQYPATSYACNGPPELPSTPCKDREEPLISFDRLTPLHIPIRKLGVLAVVGDWGCSFRYQ